MERGKIVVDKLVTLCYYNIVLLRDYSPITGLSLLGTFMTEEQKYWQMPYETWLENFKRQLPTKGSGDTVYITYHEMIRALREFVPNVIPEFIAAPLLGDNTQLVEVRLWNNALGLPTQTHKMAVMRLGGKMHNAIPLPDSRLLTDGIRRAICRVISEETGLGYSCWFDDEYEHEQPAQQMPWQQQQPQQTTNEPTPWDDWTPPQNVAGSVFQNLQPVAPAQVAQQPPMRTR